MQFHLSQLRGTAKTGAWGLPYDSGRHITYRLAQQSEDIKQYHLVLEVWGKNDYENGLVTISDGHYQKEQLVARQAGPLAAGQSILIYPSSSQNLVLQLPFEVERTSCNYQFNYGNSETDGVRWSAFSDHDAGYEPWPKRKAVKPQGQYCYTTEFPQDARGPSRKIQ